MGMQALNTALLTLPESFTERELYVKITGISYNGDIRMSRGFENRQKIENIVDGAFDNFKKIYRKLLYEYDVAKLNVNFDNSDDEGNGNGIQEIHQDLSSATIYKKLSACPLNLQISIARIAGKNDRHMRDTEEVLRSVAHHPIPMDFVNSALCDIVGKKSKESVKLALYSAGPVRGVRYGLEKL